MSLLSWSEDPAAARSPLPPLSTVQRSRGFPVPLLPFDALAADLAHFDLFYVPRRGFASSSGVPVDETVVVDWASRILRVVAGNLWSQESPLAFLDRHRAEVDASSDALQARAHREVEDYDDAEATFAAYDVPNALARPMLNAADHNPRWMEAEDRWGDLGERFRDQSVALSSTARSLAYPQARKYLLQNLRAAMAAPPGLPGPEAPSAVDATLGAFLAQFDDRPRLRRSDLGRAEGAPSFRRSKLYAAAAHRWGAPRVRDGYPTYYPQARLSERKEDKARDQGNDDCCQHSDC